MASKNDDLTDKRNDADAKAQARIAERSRATTHSLGAGQKSLLIGSIALTAIGLVLMVIAWFAAPGSATPGGAADADKSATGSGGVDSSIVSGFSALPGGEDGDAATAEESEPSALQDWSPAVFRLGFSFFVGFAIAYALRAFVKMSILVIGVLLIALFGLQYAGVIQVDWSAMEGYYDSAFTWIRSQASSFKGFITGYLPSAASATGGMVMGFRRK